VDAPLELTGPIAAKLFVSSSTTDADLFLVVRVFAPDGSEVVFQGAVDPHTPVAQGWLRVSHRELDTTLSEPYRPYHTHRARQPMTPGQVYEVDVEIWPTCIVVPAGYRIGLTVRGRDYEYAGAEEGASLGHFKGSVMKGCGIYLHDDAGDRPPDVYAGTTTLHAGPRTAPYVLLPVVPPG
jgi:predicted acyl esterase